MKWRQFGWGDLTVADRLPNLHALLLTDAVLVHLFLKIISVTAYTTSRCSRSFIVVPIPSQFLTKTAQDYLQRH